MSRRSDLLIKAIRKYTENEEFGTLEGIDDSEFLQALNDAQNRLHSLIVDKHSKAFLKVAEPIAVLPGIREYELPIDTYIDNKVYMVEYSETGLEEDYFPLDLESEHHKITDDGCPTYYHSRMGKIILSPIPQTAGKARITYTKRVTQVDTRRGRVLSATLDNNAKTITSLVLDTIDPSTPLDSDALNECDYICIVDKRGKTKMRNIPIDAVSSGTGTVTLDAHVFETGETIDIGDYVVCGEDTSTHPIDLPRSVERYLISYGKWYILKRDSSVDYAEAQTELLEMENDIVNSFAEAEQDIIRIPDIGDCW